MLEIKNYTYEKDILQNPDTTSFFELFYLMVKNRYKLFDDEYFSGGKDEKAYIERVFNIVKDYSPYFWRFVGPNGELGGFCYLYDVIYKGANPYSACASICFDKNYWGKPALFAAKRLIIKEFLTLNIAKVKAECFSDNLAVSNFLEKLGFKREAYLKNETISRGKPADIVVWSLFNPYLKPQKSKKILSQKKGKNHD